MLKKNEEYIADIIDNGFQGEGIAKIDGITIFIPQAIKGEKIKIKILKVLKNFGYGKIIEILEKSENREIEDCTTYKRCGGCNLRHIKYEETLNIKKSIVENCLYKQLRKEVKVNNVIGMDKPYCYRNKLQYPFGFNDNKKVMGIYSERTHNIISTTKCLIQNELCQEIANTVFDYVKQNKIKIYDEKTGDGTLRHIVLRIGIKTNEVLLTLVVNDNGFKKFEDDFIEQIVIKYPEIKSIVLNYNTEKTNVILGKKCETIYGREYIYDILGDYKFKISPLSFYQVNPIQTEILYNTAINHVGTGLVSAPKENIALDLYCGIGTIGIFASKYFKKVYGIEIVDQAIRDAKENAKINSIENIEFYARQCRRSTSQNFSKRKNKTKCSICRSTKKGIR